MKRKEILREPFYTEEIIAIIRGGLSSEELFDKLHDYHENDIAQCLDELTPEERSNLYDVLGPKWTAEVMAYVDEPSEYASDFDVKSLAEIIDEMDSGDAVDFLEELDDKLVARIQKVLSSETKEEIKLINSYEDDEIGSLLTTNYIAITSNLSIKQAMKSVISQAGENDNISTIYVVDEGDKFIGAIDLKDLIVAREGTELEELISYSYPTIQGHELIADCIERVKDYAEDSLPILNEDMELIGIITAQDIIEAVDDEMGDDYAKLAGLTAEEDLNETTLESMKKRMPWLIVLLFLGMGVSSVVGAFESVVATLPIVMCFQSLILDMAGNVGTQSLAVTIRVLMDEDLKARDKLKLVVKEIRVGFSNGILLGAMALAVLGVYIKLFKGYSIVSAFLISGCVGVSLLLAMIISSLVGTLVPMFFHKINIDPAVASGPLITTVNDLVAVITYYGLAWIVLIQVMQIV